MFCSVYATVSVFTVEISTGAAANMSSDSAELIVGS